VQGFIAKGESSFVFSAKSFCQNKKSLLGLFCNTTPSQKRAFLQKQTRFLSVFSATATLHKKSFSAEKKKVMSTSRTCRASKTGLCAAECCSVLQFVAMSVLVDGVPGGPLVHLISPFFF